MKSYVSDLEAEAYLFNQPKTVLTKEQLDAAARLLDTCMNENFPRGDKQADREQEEA